MYGIDDCCLVRKTSVFPKDGVIETPVHGKAYSFGTSSLVGDALRDKLRSIYRDDDKFIEELHKYDIYFETYRSTIHFTINGVVANSMYGDFTYPYAILEPFKYHALEDSLKGLRVEDTYFNDDIHLSDEAIVLVPEDRAFDLEKEHSFNGLKVITYSGSLDDAIKEKLIELGYDYFVVNDHGYTKGIDEGTKDKEMYDFIGDYANKNGISREKHFYSKYNYDDQMNRMEAAEQVDLMHLEYIFDSGLVNEELINKIKNILPNKNYFKKEFNDLMKDLIDEVGLDQLLFLTNEFNKMMINERQKSKVNQK